MRSWLACARARRRRGAFSPRHCSCDLLLAAPLRRSAAAPRPAVPQRPCNDEQKPVVILSYWKSRHRRAARAGDRARRPAGRHAGLLRQLLGFRQAAASEAAEGPEAEAARAARADLPADGEVGLPPVAADPGARSGICSQRSARWKRRGRIPRMQRLMKMGGGAALRLGARARAALPRPDPVEAQGAPARRVLAARRDPARDRRARRGAAARLHPRRAARVSPTGGRSSATSRCRGSCGSRSRRCKLAGRRARGDLAVFWRQLDRSTIYLVGEEYPDFTGPARRAARRQSRGQARLWHAGGARRSLARKYVAGMTPGYRLARASAATSASARGRRCGAGGARTSGRARARASRGSRQYNFRHRNARSPVMNDVLRALAHGVRVSRR